MIGKKRYLGDSVWAAYSGHYIILYTDHGFGPQNEIYLDDQVLAELAWFKRDVVDFHLELKYASSREPDDIPITVSEGFRKK